MANTTVSTPELAKKKRKDDEASIVESLLSNNRYSTDATAINDSDLGDFGEVPEVEILCEESPIHPTSSSRRHREGLSPLVVKNLPMEQLIRKIPALRVSAEFKLTKIGTKVMVHTKPEYGIGCVPT